MKKLLLTVLFLLVFPSFVSAQTISCINLKNNMRQGMKNTNTNNEVVLLQNFLKANGFFYATPNGSFGPATLLAVKKFQSSMGMGIQGTPGYGGVGPKTRAKIKEMTCGKAVTTSVTTPTSSENVVSVTYSAQTSTGVQNQATTYQLQSEFLKNEPIAQQIASGQLKSYDIKNYGFILGAVKPNANNSDFAYRFISGIRMTGQIIGRNTAGGQYPSVGLLNKFQSYWGIPISPYIDIVVLKKLDSILASREPVEKSLAMSFPLYSHLIDAPINQETKTHVAYLFAQTFKELPSSIVVWSEQNFKDYFVLQLSGHYSNINSPDYKICDAFLYDGVGDNCSVMANYYPKVFDDFDTMNTKIHEYAHYIDRNLYSRNPNTSQGAIDTTNFYAISYDISNFSISPTSGWKAYALKNTSNTKYERVSSYARGWGSVEADGVFRTTAYEDFAESFAMYVTQGKIFRKLAETNPVLGQKYEWLKQNVFGGQEYQSGDIAGITTIKARPTGLFEEVATGAGNVRDYTQSLPDFVWNYKFLAGSVATK